MPALPRCDPANIWHRVLGASNRTYALCCIIVGATTPMIARALRQVEFPIVKLKCEIDHLINPDAAMPGNSPPEFRAAVSVDSDAALLCHRFGAFPVPAAPQLD